MSDQAWVVESILKYQLVVHANCGLVSALVKASGDFIHEQFTVGDYKSFVNAFDKIVKEINK